MKQCKKEKDIRFRTLTIRTRYWGENGSKDLLSMLEYLYGQEKAQTFEFGFCFKRYLSPNNSKKLGTSFRRRYREGEKASEQRVRRAIYQSLNHLD